MNIYKNGKFINTEEVDLTLSEYIKSERMLPGQCLGLETPGSTTTFYIWIGDATPDNPPVEYDTMEESSAANKWDFDSEICERRVMEVHSFLIEDFI